jgi:tetratricopeptide (TPR) repeat protein
VRSVPALLALLIPILCPRPLDAQQNATLARAQAAYTDLDYAVAIAGTQAALQEALTREDQVLAYELLGYSYGALDSTRQAVEAFQQLIFLAPDREPDVERVSPRITSLYASALGQVLVVRRLRVDSASFVAGAGSAPVRYEVSRAAQTTTRLVGPGVDLVIDSQAVSGSASTRVDWRVLDSAGRPLPAGEYQVIATAREGGRTEFSSLPLRLTVTHGPVDTLPRLTALPGYVEQPEMVTPPRDWRPMLVTVLYTGIGAGAFLAVENGSLGSGPRTAMFAVSGAALATGLAMSLRKADPRPSPSNILYNQLLRELLARQNADIARENAIRRAQVLVTVTPSP